MTYKDKLVFFQVGLNAVLNMMNGLLKIKRVLYLQKVYMKITILEKIPIGILPQLTKYYT